tara:strand:+ start:775 stop:2382 length:1608 start_codon:yes stop_codon:yes gene_type:complete
MMGPGSVQLAYAEGEFCQQSVAGRTIGDSTILSAILITSGEFSEPNGRKHAALPAFCRVVAVSRPSLASNILIEVWLPVSQHWNGKFLATGNGGFAGAIRYDSLAGGLKRGYAVANTDMGTYPAAAPGIGYAAGNNRPEVVKDWGERATHAMAIFSKQVIKQYYQQPPRFALFAGCSTGGHQGLTELQRYPNDFDGILAGAPGHNRTHLHAMFADLMLKIRQPGATMSPPQFQLWVETMQSRCIGKDGGTASDTFLTDPTQCDITPQALACQAGSNAEICLQPGQVKVLDSIYDGTRNSQTGELIYPPVVYGAEAILASVLTNHDAHKMPVPDDLHRWVFGPDWDAASFDFAGDMAQVDKALGKYVNALDADATAFVAQGGKLIMYHGWADMVVSPLDSIIYFDRLHAKGAGKEDYARLYMAPGVSHCAGGDGPDMFGQGAAFPVADASRDMLLALDQWVENGVAPESVIAVKYATQTDQTKPPEVRMTRPLCPYPQIALYDGKGDPLSAASFSCQRRPARYEMPAAQYLGEGVN